MAGVVTLLLLSLTAGVIELRVHVSAPVTALRAGDSTRRITLLKKAIKSGTMRRERRPELGPHQLVLVTVDRDGAQLDWRAIADPRVVRVETADADGFLSGQLVTLDSSEFTVRIPFVPGAEHLQIYATHANESGFGLTMVGEVALAR
jgi:hypothetical protein